MVDWTTLGKTGIKVSRFCVGTWQASGWATSDDRRFVATLRHTLDQGVNFIDTALSYGKGHSEGLIGIALKGHRKKFVIASKFPYKKAAPEQIRSSLETSLFNLGTDYIDIYYQHWPPKTPPLEDSIGELVRLKEEGKIRAIGVSNWMEPEFEEFKNLDVIDCLQPNYSLLFRSIEPHVLPLCQKHSIAVMPYSPLCQGILAGKFSSLDDIPKDPRRQNRFLTPEIFPDVLRLISIMQEVALTYRKTLAQVALRWLLQQEGVTAPIVGASSPEQAEENLGAFGWELAEADLRTLTAASMPLSTGLRPHDSLWNFHPREL